MKAYRYMLAIAAAASLAACSDDKNEPGVSDETFTTVVVNAEVGRGSFYSRAAVTGDGEAQRYFTPGDVIGVSDGAATDSYSYDGKEWSAAAQGFTWGEYSVNFKAWYPVSASYSSFTLPADQSTPAKLQAADYMTAARTVDACPAGGVLLLDFDRHMSRVMLRISGIDPENGEVETVAVQSGSSKVPADGVATSVAAYDAGEGLYVALTVPGEGDDSAPFITITTSAGKTFHIDGIPATEAAKSYSYDLYIGKSTLTLGRPAVEDWTTGATLDGVLADVTYETDPGFFVTPAGKGDKSGSTWENAMDLKTFRDKIHRPVAAEVNDMTFYLAEGDYDMFSDYRGETTIGDASKTPLNMAIKGGYDASLTGTDVSKRDLDNHPTRFIRSAAAPTWKTKFFWVGDKANVTFDGIDFEGGYDGSQRGNLLCIHSSNISLTVNNCRFNGFSHEGEGAAIYAEGTRLKLSNSTITNCVCEQGAVASRNGAGYNMLNNVVFHDNSSYGKWGVHLNSKHPVMMNNVTMYGDRYIGSAADNSSPIINANGNAFFSANSTFYSTIHQTRRHDGIIRLSLAGGESIFINNVFGSSDPDDVSLFDGDGHRTTSAGYNVYMHVSPAITMGATDLALSAFPAPAEVDGTLSFETFAMPSYATLSDITAACSRSKSGDFPTLGAEFADWVGDDFAVDARGVKRNTSRMHPGAFDPALNH